MRKMRRPQWFLLGALIGVALCAGLTLSAKGRGCAPQKEGGVSVRGEGMPSGNDGGCMAGYTMVGGVCYVRD